MSKAVAVPYIIALIIGIVVVGIIGYWFFSLAGKGGGAATTVGCDAKTLSYCQNWRDSGWPPKPILVGWDKSCGPEPRNPKECSVKLGLECDCLAVKACQDKGYNSIFQYSWPDCGTFCCK